MQYMSFQGIIFFQWPTVVLNISLGNISEWLLSFLFETKDWAMCVFGIYLNSNHSCQKQIKLFLSETWIYLASQHLARVRKRES